MPWTDHPSIFNGPLAERPAFMGTSSIEHTDIAVDIGDAKRAALYGNFENQPGLGQFGLRTDAQILIHVISPALCRFDSGCLLPAGPATRISRFSPKCVEFAI